MANEEIKGLMRMALRFDDDAVYEQLFRVLERGGYGSIKDKTEAQFVSEFKVWISGVENLKELSSRMRPVGVKYLMTEALDMLRERWLRERQRWDGFHRHPWERHMDQNMDQHMEFGVTASRGHLRWPASIAVVSTHLPAEDEPSKIVAEGGRDE